MSEKLDFEVVKQQAGDDAWTDEWVYIPKISRILLSKFVKEDAFLTPLRNQIYYGPDSQNELYEVAKVAYSSIMNPITIAPLDEAGYALSSGISLLQQFPGIIAIWPMSLIDGNGRAGDASGNGYHLTQSASQGVKFSYSQIDNTPPMGSFSNNADHLYYADGNPFNITGSTFYTNNPGLTIGAWIRKASTQANAGFVLDKGGASSYVLYILTSTRTPRIEIAGSPGIGLTGQDMGTVWGHVVARFTPGQELAIFTNGNKTTVSTTVNTIPGSASTFRMGGNLFTGNISQAFVSMSAVPDGHILRHYNLTKAAYQ